MVKTIHDLSAAVSPVIVRYIDMNVTVTHCRFTAEPFLHIHVFWGFALFIYFGPEEPIVFQLNVSTLKQEQEQRHGQPG